MREASSAVAVTQRPMMHRDLARQHRVVAEQRHQAVGELAADEGVVAAALGGAERLQLVEQRELRRSGPACAAGAARAAPSPPARRSPADARRRGRAAPRAASAPGGRRTAAARRRGLASGASAATAAVPAGRRRRRAARSPSGPASRSAAAWRAAPAMASMCDAASRARRSRSAAADSARATSVIDRSSQVRRRSKASGSPGEKAWIQARSTPSACSVGAKASVRLALPASAKAVRSKTLAAPMAIWRRSSPVRWVSSDSDSTGATLVTASGRDGAGNP